MPESSQNGTQRDLGALNAEISALREQVDTQFGVLAAQVSDIRKEFRDDRNAQQRRESSGPDRTIAILGLIVAVIVPCGLVLSTLNDAKLETRDVRLSYVEDRMHDAEVKLDNRSGRISALESFSDEQRLRNARNDRNADAMSVLATKDKDALELDAFHQLSKKIDDLDAKNDGRLSRLETAVGHLRAEFSNNLPGGDD